MGDGTTRKARSDAELASFNTILTDFLEKVQNKRGSEAKKQMFLEFLDKWREFYKQLRKAW